MIKKASEGNDVESMLELAAAYYSREAGEENRWRCFDLLKRILEIDPNHAEAINRMGNCYNNGVGVDEDEDEAMKYYLKAAELGFCASQYNYADSLKKRGDAECLLWYQKAYENGDSDGAYEIGMMYLEGHILNSNIEKAITYLKKAAEMDNRAAILQLACEYMNGDTVEKNITEGMALMEKAAELGSDLAAENLSNLYRKGEDTTQDLNKALEWAKKTIELGSGEAMYNMAVTYLYGECNVEKNEITALNYFMESAKAGFVSAMHALALFYYEGTVVAKDSSKALEWAEAAGRKGEPKCLDMLKEIYEEVDPEHKDERYFSVVKDAADDGYYEGMVRLYLHAVSNECSLTQDELNAYLDNAVAGGYGKACFICGVCCFAGDKGYEKNVSKAIELWEIAAEKDIIGALEKLGDIYSTNEYVEMNPEKAKEYYERVGSGVAYYKIAQGYYNENGFLGQDYNKALEYFTKAYESGYIDAAGTLSIMYEEGKGTEKDIKRSFEYLKEIADAGNGAACAKIGYYYSGAISGVEVDIYKAIPYLEKAKEKGVIEADKLLDIIEEQKGKGNLEEFAKAWSESMLEKNNPEEYFKVKLHQAEQGDVDAQFAVAKAYHTGEGVEENFEQSEYWMAKAADGGHVLAQSVRGTCLYRIECNPEAALKYVIPAANAGNAEALCCLADMYNYGEAVQEDKAKAFSLYLQSAEGGNRRAQTKVGGFYITGDVCEFNLEEGVKWLKKAEEQGDPEAQHLLGIYYCSIDSPDKNIELGMEMLQKAIDQGFEDAKETMEKYKKEYGYSEAKSQAEEIKTDNTEVYKETLTTKKPEVRDEAKETQPPKETIDKTMFRITQKSIKLPGGILVVGMMEKGEISVGDMVYVGANAKYCKVIAITSLGKTLEKAEEGKSVGIMLKDIERKDIVIGEYITKTNFGSSQSCKNEGSEKKSIGNGFFGIGSNGQSSEGKSFMGIGKTTEKSSKSLFGRLTDVVSGVADVLIDANNERKARAEQQKAQAEQKKQAVKNDPQLILMAETVRDAMTNLKDGPVKVLRQNGRYYIIFDKGSVYYETRWTEKVGDRFEERKNTQCILDRIDLGKNPLSSYENDIFKEMVKEKLDEIPWMAVSRGYSSFGTALSVAKASNATIPEAF